jgi:chromosomal replication initiator protein
MELAAEALGLKAKAGSTNTSIQSIIEAVVGFYDIRLSDLQSKKRTRSIALPRQVCMYLAKHNTHHSLQEIGGYFGGRDHTTVMHAVKTVHSKRAADEQFNTAIKTLENKLRPASSV